jgi:hypothetical protein
LEWARFSCVALGLTLRSPVLHHVTENHFATAWQGMQRGRERGYRRVGFLFSAANDSLRVGDRWLGAFLAQQQLFPQADRLPPCATVPVDGKSFREWFGRVRPDALRANHARPVLAWLERMGLRVQQDGRDAKRPDYGAADLRTGFSLDLWFNLESAAAGQVLLESRDARGRGLWLTTTTEGAVRITLNDGRTESSWASDAKTVLPGQLRHLVVTVDGGPKIITFVVDGVLCDGGEERQFGWGRFSAHLRAPNGAEQMKLAPGVSSLRIYRRALRTSEAVGNFRAGL